MQQREFEKNEEGQHYYYREKLERVSFEVVTKKAKNNILGSMIFRVHQITSPVAQVVGQSNGIMYKNRLLVAPRIGATLLNFDFDARFVITKFSVSIVRNDSSVFVKNNDL